jgi:RecB family exonuclease
VITPRTTRLVRVPDLAAFRGSLIDLACEGVLADVRRRIVVVPTRAAAAYLLRSIEDRRLGATSALALPDLIAPGELLARLGERLADRPQVLGATEREVLAGTACRRAIEDGIEPPFSLRPGLVAEIVRLYDSLQRNQKQIDTFERLALGALEPGALDDRGGERLVRQTRFLATAFRYFEQLMAATGRMDEHGLRRHVRETPAADPWHHLVLAVGDASSDRYGLHAADWDLLSKLPGLARLDIVATDAVVAGAFHERIHRLLPGIEEVRFLADDNRSVPTLVAGPDGEMLWTARDREEEVAGFARWVRREARSRRVDGRFSLNRMALVVHRPLPYVYLAREVLRAAGIPYQMFDALPLASEPYAAALDVVMEFVTGHFGRVQAVALLRSPHFRFENEDGPLSPREVSAFDRDLSEAGYLGDLASLGRLIEEWRTSPRPVAGLRAAEVTAGLAVELLPLCAVAPCGMHLDRMLSFLTRYEHVPPPDDPVRSRHMRGRGAIFDVLTSLRDAYTQFDGLPVEFAVVAAVIRRWIDAHTFAPRTGESGVHVVDAESARFGDFDSVQLAGLVDGEWPDTPRRNIFYPPALLRELGWPSESERLDGIRAMFSDLLRLPDSRVVVSTFTLEDDAIVAASTLVDEVPVAGLPAVAETTPIAAVRIFDYEALGLEPVETQALGPRAQAAVRRRLLAAKAPRAGMTAGHEPAAYSLSALERYQDCPFKFFAADVMKLQEPPEDLPMLSPRARGRFVHEVFQRFFEAWDSHGHGPIDVDRIDEARALFQDIAEPILARFSQAEASLERTRLFGSAVSVGIVDVVLGLEASRPTPVRERWLEYRLEGEFSLGAPEGLRVPLKGVADRIDLMDGDRLRVIDYKSGYPPNPKRALQVPIYALCAQERLEQRDGRRWQVDEAAYVALAGKRPLVPVIRPGGDAKVLASARARVIALTAGIQRGEFPVRPYELRLCSYCAYPSVCRKDYVGDD